MSEMVEAERSCPDVILQIVTVRSTLDRVAQIILKDHAETCLVEAFESGTYESESKSFRAALNMLL
ncbi:MAG: metal-sensitive transcriptional regulator [Phormidesmis sp. CAN_BIN44]|nr:metal-sensitive transcriptional regulator [Phormidesmis sp. CAN_BIN44]